MPSKPPEGCLTRPEAAKLFNRSRRALERDLDLALSMQDADVLDHWCLVTKDGEVRNATGVATNQVKQMVADGMTPTWFVQEDWLEREYGRKGTTKSAKSRDNDKPSAQPTPKLAEPEQSIDTASSSESPLPSQIVFLQERILTLEREKKEEAARAGKREAKLFAQLAVKDKQIKSWDGITQGLTRGLATGQLVPSLLRTGSDTAPNRPAPDVADSQTQSVQDATLVEHQPPAKPKQTQEKTPARSKQRPKQKRPKGVFEKHTPTFHKLASGLLRRS